MKRTLQSSEVSAPDETVATRAKKQERENGNGTGAPGAELNLILASLQVVDGTSGRTEAMMMPASQQVVRETTPGPGGRGRSMGGA